MKTKHAPIFLDFIQKICYLFDEILKQTLTPRYKIVSIDHATNIIVIYNNFDLSYTNVDISEIFKSNKMINKFSKLDACRIGIEYGRFEQL